MNDATAGRRAGLIIVAACAGLAMAGCSRNSDSSGAAAPASGGAYASERGGRSAGGYGSGYGERADHGPVPMFHGEPMWSENRSHSAKENAEYHFERAGPDLGSKTLDDFLTKVHRFGDHPPAGTLKIARANGDKLLYDPKSNLFAVFNREGAPRTVFKPSTGIDYWNEQKSREQAEANGGGEGGYGGYRSRSHGANYGGERSGRSEGSGDQGE